MISVVSEARRSVSAMEALNGTRAELTETDIAMLDFERQWWKFAGAKEKAVWDAWRISTTRYYQILNALIDQPAALEFDPLLVRRLRRLRAARQRQRSARRLGFEDDLGPGGA